MSAELALNDLMRKLATVGMLRPTIPDLRVRSYPTSSELHMFETLWHVFIASDLFSAFISTRFLPTNPPEP